MQFRCNLGAIWSFLWSYVCVFIACKIFLSEMWTAQENQHLESLTQFVWLCSSHGPIKAPDSFPRLSTDEIVFLLGLAVKMRFGGPAGQIWGVTTRCLAAIILWLGKGSRWACRPAWSYTTLLYCTVLYCTVHVSLQASLVQHDSTAADFTVVLVLVLVLVQDNEVQCSAKQFSSWECSAV